MDESAYAYTVGMESAEVERRLREAATGVLSLAEDGDAYAIPVAHHFDGERLLLRLADDGQSRKVAMADATETACYVVYGFGEGVAAESDQLGWTEGSWSVLVEGPIRRLDEGSLDEAALNQVFPPLRVFDEAPEAVELHLYELVAKSATGRHTGASSRPPSARTPTTWSWMATAGRARPVSRWGPSPRWSSSAPPSR